MYFCREHRERERENNSIEHRSSRHSSPSLPRTNDRDTRRGEEPPRHTTTNHDRTPGSERDKDVVGESSRHAGSDDRGATNGRTRELSKSPVRDSRSSEPHHRSSEPKSDSAFNNVMHGSSLISKEDPRKESEKLHEAAMHPSAAGMIPTSMSMSNMSMFDRSRLGAMQFGPPMHPLDRPPGHGGPWEPFRSTLDALHREQQLRPDIREYERDRLMRAGLPPVGPPSMMEQVHDRFRDREPHHDFTRDNPLGLDPLRRLEHEQHERMQRYLEDRDRAIREEAVERTRLLHGSAAAEHAGLVGLPPRHLSMMPPSAGGIPFPRNSMMYPNSVHGHKNGSPSSLGSQPPPLIPTASVGGASTPAASRSHNSSPAAPLQSSSVRNNSSSPPDPALSKDKLPPSEKESSSR